MKDLHIVAWGLWIGGTILIVGSWSRIVPNEIGWIGFLAAGAGTALLNQVVSAVGAENLAIGRCAKRLNPAGTSVLVEIVGTPVGLDAKDDAAPRRATIKEASTR